MFINNDNSQIVDIFAFLDRRSLCILELCTARLAALIQAHFSGKPPFVWLDKTRIDFRKKQFSFYIIRQRRYELFNDFQSFQHLFAQQYVRVRRTALKLHNDPLWFDGIRAIQHIWTDSDLTVHLPEEPVWSHSCATISMLIKKCVRLFFFIPAYPSSIALKELDCHRMDMDFDEAVENWEAVLDWLCNDQYPSSILASQIGNAKFPNDRRLLFISCRWVDSFEEIAPLIEAFKKRFINAKNAAAIPFAFGFQYIFFQIPESVKNVKICNLKTNEMIRCIFTQNTMVLGRFPATQEFERQFVETNFFYRSLIPYF